MNELDNPNIKEVNLEENQTETGMKSITLPAFLKNYKKLLISTCILIIVAISAVAFVSSIRVKNPESNEIKTSSTEPEKTFSSATPSLPPLPFQELTIPYLTSRSYSSNINDLSLINETGSYTSYLTSYDSDGLKINGLLYFPSGNSPDGGWPAVVFIHGYIPPNEYDTLENYNSYAGYLASQGLVVFKIDLRGQADSEGVASGAYYSGDYIIDALNARSALQNLDNVNPDKVGLWGHSMAGNVVFRSLTAMPDIKKVVIWAGAVYTYQDFQNYRIQDTSYQPPADDSERRRKREELFNTHGSFDPDSPFWSQVPATNYLNQIKGEIQIHHAVNDNVVSIDYSRNLSNILKEAGIPHQLFEYSTGGHNLVSPTFNTAMTRSAEFLKSD